MTVTASGTFAARAPATLSAALALVAVAACLAALAFPGQIQGPALTVGNMPAATTPVFGALTVVGFGVPALFQRRAGPSAGGR
jgi:hypothetical protein